MKSLFFGALLAASMGCGNAETSALAGPEDVLRTTFAAETTEVLESGDGFVAGDERLFGGVPERGSVRSVELSFPRSNVGPFLLESPAGLRVEVTELGAAGASERAGKALIFPRTDGGATFYTTAPQGLASWTYVPAGAAEVRLVWRVSAPLVNDGERVLVRDDDGLAHFTVTAPRAVTASGQTLTPHIEASGQLLTVVVHTGGEAALIDPIWAATGTMSSIRGAHTATLLTNGTVLAAGGRNAVTTLTSSEVFTPANGVWKVGNTLGSARATHTATLLGSGKVLVAAGHSGATALNQAELYDPVTAVFGVAASLQKNRYEHTATLLMDGRVLIAGGLDAGAKPLNHAEIYDPATNTWTAAALLATGRARHAATLLASGKVLVTGGRDSTGTSVATAELYDPSANAWSPMGAMPSGGRESHQSLLLANGKVLLVAGLDQIAAGNGVLLKSCDLWDSGTGTWSVGGDLALARYHHDALVLANGKVLAAGGDAGATTATAELYDPTSNTWSTAPAMGTARANHLLTLLQDGRVLASGGDSAAATSELYAPATPGTPCTQDGECASGFCATGVCCKLACGASCQSCLGADTGAGDGTCAPVKAGLDPKNDCADLGAAACSTSGACDGGGKCQLYPNGTVCLGPTCGSPTSVDLPSTCLGGVCNGSGSVDCAPFTCVSGACASICVIDADCDPSAYCDAGTCTAKLDVGAGCVSDGQCFTGACADSVCCNDTCTGACDACSLAAGGQSDGQCTPATGAPCDDGDACTQVDTCQAGTCTGASPVSCMAAGPCREAGTCDPASGACNSPVKQDGAPCATPTEEPGTCFAGDCVPDPDGTSSSGSGSGSAGSGVGGGGDGGSAASGAGAANSGAGAGSGNGDGPGDGDDAALRGAGCAFHGSPRSDLSAIAFVALALLALRRRAA